MKTDLLHVFVAGAAAALILLSSPASAQPYVFNLTLAKEETKPAGQRNICGYSSNVYSNGAQYLVVIQAPTTDKACPKAITWTEKGTQIGSGTECQYDMRNGTTAVAGYVDSRSNSCWSESYVEWK
jgi:hypothetical protein